MITRRDIFVATLSIAGCCIGLSLAHSAATLIGPSVYDWKALTANKTDVGEYRHVMRGPTATLDELEMHVTTLVPGKDSHAAHRHPNEELVIIREGTVEVLSDGEWKRLGPGSIVFNASNSLHALRNVGDIPAVYHVVNWKSAATPTSTPTQRE
jgi:XRE family transcriptional regulator, regulator of sulfur utilization